MGELGNNKDSGISLIPVGELKEEVLTELKKYFSSEFNSKNIDVTNDLADIKIKLSKQVLVLNKSSLTKSDLINIKNKLLIQDHPVDGWIFLDSEN